MLGARTTYERARYTLSLLAIGIALIGWMSSPYFHSLKTEWYARALASVYTHVRIGDTVYIVDHGNVTSDGVALQGREALPALSLAYEKLLAQRSPLLSIAGTNTESLRAALPVLERVAENLSEQQAGAREIYLVAHNLYPTRFLRAVAELEDARVRFIESGSHEDALRYESAEALAIEAYLSDLKRFRSAFAEVVPADIGRYQTERYIISPDDVLHALDSLHTAMLRTKRQHEERFACFRGKSSACEATDTTQPLLLVPEVHAPTSSMLESARVLRAADSAADPTLIPEDTTLYLLSQSSCISQEPVTSFLFSLRAMPPSLSLPASMTPYYAGDIRFLESGRHQLLPYLTFFSKQHITYVPSRPWLYYDCQTPGPDSSGVIALSDVRAFATTHTLSDDVSGTDAETLRALEHTLRGNVVSERDVARYLNTATALAEKDTLSEKESREVGNLLLEMRNGSGGLYQAVFETARGEEVNLTLNETKGIPVDFSAKYLFFTRSNFASFFLAGNPSAVGEMGALFPPHERLQGDTPYVYYSKASTAEREKMRNDLTYYVQLHLLQ